MIKDRLYSLPRMEWLRALRDHGPSPRPAKSRVGFNCMKLGWTEWSYIDLATGERVSWGELQARYGANPPRENMKLDFSEQLTPAGRKVLEEFER